MSEARKLNALPLRSDFANLSVILTDGVTGNMSRGVIDTFARSLAYYLLNPVTDAGDVDSAVTPGIYLLDGKVSGTLPELPLPEYGHLIVLGRRGLVQQVFIGRSGIALRFQDPSSGWKPWVILKA